MQCTGAQEIMFFTCCWSSGRNNDVECEFSVGVRRSPIEKPIFSTADVSKVACRGMGRPFAEPRSEILSGGRKSYRECAVSVACPSCPDYSPEPPGPGRIIRNMLGWSQLEKTASSGVWLFWGALRGENLFSSLCAAGDWFKEGIVPHSVVGPL